MVDALLDVLPLPACLCEPSSGKILHCNTHAIALWGRPPQTDAHIHDMVRFVRPDGTPVSDDETPHIVGLAGPVPVLQQAVIVRPGMDSLRVSLDIMRVRSAHLTREAGLLVFHSDPARRRRDLLLAAQKRVLEMIARGAPLARILDALTGIVEQQAGGAGVAAICLLEPDGMHLRHAGSPRLPENFKKALDGQKIGPHVATAAAAASLRRVVVTEAISEAAGWTTLSQLPLALGFQAAWSMPIISSTDDVLGTFDTYFLESRGPTAEEQEIVELLSSTAAIAIERQQAADLALEANRRKDEFLAMLAHELRNPLAPIRAAAQLLGFAERDESIPPKVRGVVERQVQTMTRLIDDLLDVSRITRGAVGLQLVTMDVGRIVSHAIETASPLLEKREHRLTVTAPEGPLPVYVDATRMEQVIVNLLANAAKFTAKRGEIALRVSNREDDTVTIQVTDNGRGISKSLLPRIFEMFTQGSRSLDRSDGGLGIGLTVAHRLVEMQGGSLVARSDGAGCGSEFTIKLPRASGPCADEVAIPQTTSAGSRRILIVEDQRDAAEMLAMVLTAQSHQVRVVGDGHAALGIVGQFRPDLMLIDIGLPGMSGYDLAERIRSERTLPNVFLVALTGYGSPEDRSHALRCGFDRHVVKPIDDRGLDELVRQASQPRRNGHHTNLGSEPYDEMDEKITSDTRGQRVR
jgi:signal transduction histidine kinase/FixJ family two-component response regulator